MDKCDEKDCKWFDEKIFNKQTIEYAPLVCVQCGCFIRDKYNKVVEKQD